MVLVAPFRAGSPAGLSVAVAGKTCSMAWLAVWRACWIWLRSWRLAASISENAASEPRECHNHGVGCPWL